MNRADIREAAAFERSMIVNPNDTEKIKRLNTLIDLATRRFAAEHAEAFVPDVEYIVLLPDMTDKTVKRTVATTADTRVLQFSGAFDGVTYPTNGSWDGLYHVEVVEADGTIHRYQCLEFWIDTDLVGTQFYRVSLARPVDFAGSGLAWRLHMPAFWLHSDVARINQGQLYLDAPGQTLPLPRDHFVATRRTDFRGGQNSQPLYYWRDQHYQVPAPSRVPNINVTAGVIAVWGPEPIGQFEYCFTYCWGHRDRERLAPGGYQEPVWESAPSPVSAVAAPAVTSTVEVTLPDIAWMTDFNVAGTLRQGHSGLYKRLYRRRLTTGTTPSHGSIEAPNVFQHLTFVDDTVTLFVDDGSIIPDYYRRLPEAQGYYAWNPWPHQDKRYELDLWVQRTPGALANDSDAPKIHASHLPMFVALVASFFAKEDNDPAGQTRHEKEYMDLAKAYEQQQGNPSRYVPPRPWGGYSPRLRFNPVTTD